MARRAYRVLKRILDGVSAAALLFVTFPLLVLASLCILLESGRPVFFRQKRVGRHGQVFTIYKLRTLHQRPHDLTAPGQHATRVGTVLRRWALDELPQLWNVLKGEMSLVGPRPTLPDQVAQYGPFERRRLDVRPGLTGWAQVNGRNALTWPERIRLDVWYVDNQSLGLDLRILLRTPGALRSGEGVYGEGGRNEAFEVPERSTESVAP